MCRRAGHLRRSLLNAIVAGLAKEIAKVVDAPQVSSKGGKWGDGPRLLWIQVRATAATGGNAGGDKCQDGRDHKDHGQSACACDTGTRLSDASREGRLI